ncbi:MAG TPA: amidohydrolase family protein [Holophagaceae bacterium]|nr:amidohydrolase family protein [Holophagaceae bacterium]
MRTRIRALALGSMCLSLVAQEKPIAFTHARILTMEGAEIPDGTLVVHKGKVVAAGTVAVPTGAEVRDVKGKWIMPGIVDSHSHVATTGGADGSAPIQPDVRISDALNLRSAEVMKARAGGITSVNVMPGSGHLLSGQTMYLKLREGGTVDELAMGRLNGGYLGGLKMANGTNPRRQGPAAGNFPGTRAKSAALVREQFVKAQEYQRKIKAAGGDASKLPERNLGLEILVEVLEGKRVVHHHTHRHDDILTVLRLQKEFGFKVVLHHLSDGWMIADEIAKSGNPCSVIVIDSPGGKLEAKDARLSTGGALERAGAVVGFHTDDPITDSRWFLRSAALSVRAGMSREGALKAMTLNNAKILGLEDRLGSLKAGKDADFVLLSGDPLSIYTHVEETWVEGKRVFDRANPEHRKYATGGMGASHDSEDPTWILALEAEEL